MCGKLACTVPAISLDPYWAYGTFAVEKGSDRDRFRADRRPLNRSERSIRQAPFVLLLSAGCLLLGTGQAIQTSTRDANLLYRVLESRVSRQIIGPEKLVPSCELRRVVLDG